MTKEEAHEVLEDFQRLLTQYRHLSKELTEANGMAIEAIEKQIPKKPIDCYMSRVNATFHWVCNCGTYFNTDELPKYCPECGQKLNFGEDDD